jgi:hypothetical protein
VIIRGEGAWGSCGHGHGQAVIVVIVVVMIGGHGWLSLRVMVGYEGAWWWWVVVIG